MDASASIEFSIEPRDANKIAPRHNQARNPAVDQTLNNSSSLLSKQTKRVDNRIILNEVRFNNNQSKRKEKLTIATA
jgi:cell pole-organizing protein PopZ